MAKLESLTLKIGKCPCGKGLVLKKCLKKVRSTRAESLSLAMDCPACSQVWRPDDSWGLKLVSVQDEARVAALEAKRTALQEELNRLCRPIIRNMFASKKRQCKTDEFWQLKEMGITFPRGYDIDHYRKDRRTKPIEECVWLRGVLPTIDAFAEPAESARLREITERLWSIQDDIATAKFSVKLLPIPPLESGDSGCWTLDT